MKSVPYASVVGSLMYAMVVTRPDISHVVGVISRFMHNTGRGVISVHLLMLQNLSISRYHLLGITNVCFTLSSPL